MSTLRSSLFVIVVLVTLLLPAVACADSQSKCSPEDQVGPMPVHMNTLHRGHSWVRSHPFTLMGLVRMVPKPFDMAQYRAAGFQTLLAWEHGSYDQLLPLVAADRMPFHVNLEKWGTELAGAADSTEESLAAALKELDSEETHAAIRNIIKHHGCIGFLANDEITRPMHLRYTRHLLKWLRQLHPEALAYSNAHPAGHEGIAGYGHLERYLDEFAAMLEPDVLMTDVYPLGCPDGTSYDYFKLLAAVRKVALEHGLPYWMFIQSFETHGSWDRRLPSESDLRFQMFVPLTYGYTGIIYFTYDMAFERGLIEKDGRPNRLHHDAARANPEVARIGAVMRFLTSIDVRYLPGRHEGDRQYVPNDLPIDTKAWRRGAGDDRRIKDVKISAAGTDKNGLLGFFQDDHGRQYFMLTNLWHGAELSASDSALDFALKFTPEVKAIYRLSRLTGEVEAIEVVDGKLTVSLPGGTGDLFGYTADPFCGSSDGEQ